MRGNGRKQNQHGCQGGGKDALVAFAFVQLAAGQVKTVHQFHDCRYGRVDLELFHVLGNLAGCFVFLAPQIARFLAGCVPVCGLAGVDWHKPVPLFHEQAPDAGQKVGGALDALFGPFKIPFGRRGKEAEKAHGVRAVFFDHFARIDDIALRLGHLGAILENHALGQQAPERLGQVFGIDAEIAQGHGEEARIEQVKDGVFHAAYVLVNRHPVVKLFHVKGRIGHSRGSVARKIPG